MNSVPLRVVIAGGGISGLTAAFYLRRHFKQKGVPHQITLIEKSGRLGGKIHTLHRDGFVIEKGADSFLARKQAILNLTKDLGLEEELTATNPHARKTYILHNGRLHGMPPGLVLGIPTEMTPFLKTGLISPKGKLRAALDLLLPRRKNQDDESLGHFLYRRLGPEVAENMAEPLLSGIYAGDIHRLSVQATFPQFHRLEQKYRSLIIGMMKSRNDPQESADLPQIARNSTFLTYRGGLGLLVETLKKSLSDAEWHIGHPVVRLHKRESDYEVVLDEGESLGADAVILALPTSETARLLPDWPEASSLGNMHYVSAANIVMAFDAADLRFSFDGTGFVVPRKEGRTITACTWTSTKWLHTAPAGKALLRAYVGRWGEEFLVDLPDEQLIGKVRRDLREIMGIAAEPSFVEITRLYRSMPQYPIGHLQIVDQLEKRLSSELPGVFVCGAGYRGVGIPDCIRQAKEAADGAASFLHV